MKNERWYRDLFQKNADEDYDGIISAILQDYLNTSYLLSLPQNKLNLHYLHLYYCLVMAYIAGGDFLSAFSQLNGMLEQTKRLSLDAECQNFVADVQMHSALLEGFFHNKLIISNNEYLDAAAKIYDHAMGTNNQNLAEAAEIVMNQWHRINVEQGVYFVPNSPGFLQIEPTNFCNLKCTMCPREKMQRATGFMDANLFRKTLSSWSSRHVTLPLEHLVFGGRIYAPRKGTIKFFFMGEPLLHGSYPEMIEFAKGEGCKIGVQTNGLLLQDKTILEKLLQAKPDIISISIDGMNQDTYEKVRRGSSYQKIINNVKDLWYARKSFGLEKQMNIFITTIVTDRSEIERARLFLEPISPFADDILGVLLNRSHEPVFFDSNGHLKPMKKERNCFDNNQEIICREPMEKLNVLWNGDITPCCSDIDGIMKLGCATDGIDQVWRGEQTEKLHRAILSKNFTDFSICKKCKNSSCGIPETDFF